MPTKPSTTSPGWKVAATNFLVRYFSLKRARSAGVLGQAAGAAAFGLLLFAAHVDVPCELVPADVLADGGVFGLAEFHGADGGEVLGIVGRADEVLGRNAGGQLGVALLPDFRECCASSTRCMPWM